VVAGIGEMLADTGMTFACDKAWLLALKCSLAEDKTAKV